MTRDCIVVGGGVAGMVSALILARKGRRVALVERARHLAPLLRGFRRGRLRLDSGFHYAGGLGDGGILRTYFRYLGLESRLEIAPDPIQDTLRLSACNRDFTIPYAYAPLTEELCHAFPDQEPGIRTYLRAVRRIFEATPFLGLDVDEEGAPDLLHGTSLARALEDWVRDPVLRQVLAMHHFFYGVPPEAVSFVDHARFAGSYYHSARAIHGGGTALALAFEAALEEAGVELFRGREARELLLSPAGTLCGLRLADGEVLEGTEAVCTVHPRTLLRLAPAGAFRQAYARGLASAPETPSACMLFGTLTGSFPQAERGGLHIAPHVGSSLANLAAQPLSTRQLFVGLAGESAKPGERVLGVILPMAHEEARAWFEADPTRRAAEYAPWKAALVTELEQIVLRACPELQNHWQLVDAATPVTFRHWGGSPTGSLYGVQHAEGARCPLPQTRLPGLYVAGQAVTGPGVLGATVSAFVACARMVGRAELLAEVRRCT